jgi:hydroxymethylbilane synthase
MPKLIFATRPSKLARTQTEFVIDRLKPVWPDLDLQVRVIHTQGDRDRARPLPEIGGKGIFTQELEAALIAGEVDAAVHSLKDLMVEDSPGLCVGVIPAREDARDVLISPSGGSLDDLPSGAVVGTSSLRRQAQLLAYRPDLKMSPVRGNVETRVRQVQEGRYDAIVLAAAGVIRLGLAELITQYLPFEVMLPAPGQAALAVQCRVDDLETPVFLSVLEDPAVRAATTAERAFLAGLGGGCALPIAAYGYADQDGIITLEGLVASLDGSRTIRLSASGKEPAALGAELAAAALAEGAKSLLAVQV